MTRNERSALAMMLLVCIILPLGGCSKPPQMPADGRNLIGSLRTAVSAKRKDWLEENAKLIEKKHSDGKLSDEQFAEFESIVAEARSGDWAAAEKETIRLEQAQ
jgi:hypothetical protein